MTILHTPRLRLEPLDWPHLAGLNAMNARPEVMRYLSNGEPETLEGSRKMIEIVQKCWAHFGYSWWALVDKATGRVAGAGTVQHLRREAERPADLEALRANPLELGWRLHPDYWRQGLASEAAERMARFAFEHLQATELLAVRSPENTASGRVMDRLGMVCIGLDTWYGVPLATHRLPRAAWEARQSGQQPPTSPQMS